MIYDINILLQVFRSCCMLYYFEFFIRNNEANRSYYLVNLLSYIFYQIMNTFNINQYIIYNSKIYI